MTTETYTAAQAISEALTVAGIQGNEIPAEAAMTEQARQSLRRMLKAWQAKVSFDWMITRDSHTLTTSAGQTLVTPARPIRIHSVRFRRNGSDLVMTEMSAQRYDDLPNKDATGTPTQFYYDKQREAPTLYVWPVLATAAGETLEYTFEREFPDITSTSETLDVPSEAYDAVVCCLADRMAKEVGLNRPMITAEAMRLYSEMTANQGCTSISFVEEYQYA